MDSFIDFLAVACIVLSAGMFFGSYQDKDFGLFITAMAYAATGLLALAFSHWWLVIGFVLGWIFKLAGLGPGTKSGDEGQADK